MKSKIGPVTAYADAVQAGYTGTREEFGCQQAEFAKNAASVEQAKTEVNQAIESFGQTANAAKQDVISEGDKQIKRIEDAAPDLEMDREQIRKNTQDIKSKITNPPNGTTGQVLTKTENGEEWKTPTGGGSGSESPHIGDNGNWYIGETDTGVKAQGSDGDDGISPHIGENGHWYIGDTDTGVTAHGTDGYTPQKGVDYFDGEPGKNGKSAYEYAQEGGYTGTEEEFKEKLAAEYPTDVQIDGTSIVSDDGVANIPYASYGNPGVFKIWDARKGHTMFQNLYLMHETPSKANINARTNADVSPMAVTLGALDNAIRIGFTDGAGTAWTDTEKTGAWSRLSSIKTAMDEVAVAGAHYYLPEQTELTVTLPDDALPGQEITVVWYNGETPATLSIAGNILDLDYVPGANTRSEISCLWDGTYWSLISNEQAVPVTEEVTTDET